MGDEAMKGPRARAIQRARGLLPWLAGGVLALLSWTVLSSALRAVQNRHAFIWDSARRAVLNVTAADQLRAGDAWGFLGSVAGPETWPTLRLALAAAAHAVAGPAHALGVENGLSLAFTAALFLVLALACWQLSPDTGQALLILAVSTAALLGARALFVHAANGMLEVPSAVLTLAAATAWLSARERGATHPWALVILGNLLFHVRWQHGLILAGAVLLTEVGISGVLPGARAVLSALGRGARTLPGGTLLLAAALLFGTCLFVQATGGTEGRLLGHNLSVRSADGPLAFGALAFFGYVLFSLWHERTRLALIFEERPRFLFLWLFTPMVLWLLVPFTWRLRTLGRISAYDMGTPPQGLFQKLLFYPEAAWDTWSPAGARWLLLALLLATAVAAWRSSTTRRKVFPLAVLAAVEFAVLALLSRRNYQERFLFNLVPVAALAAGAWVPSIPRALPRTLLALGAAGALLTLSAPSWRQPALSATLSEGFVDQETGDACRAVAEALPIGRGVLLNETSLLHRQTCAMWVLFLARERSADVDVRAVRPRAQWQQALEVTEGCEAQKVPESLVPEGAPYQSGPLCGQRYRAGQAAP
jgi:hypothetical protein